MNQSNELIKRFMQNLLDNEIITIQNNTIVFTDEVTAGPSGNLLIDGYDENGIGPIVTEYGGRKIKAFEERKKEYLASGNPAKIKVAQDAPEYIVINKDLSPKQEDIFFEAFQDYYWAARLAEKGFGDKGEVGAFTVFTLMNADTTRVPNHLVSVAGNHSMPTSSEYSTYIERTPNATLRWLYNRYKLLDSTTTRINRRSK